MIKKHFPESELIVNSDGSIFHIHLLPEQLTDNIIVVGDPNRVNMVAAHFDTRDFEVSSREFHTIGGTYHGKPIMCLSHGIGSDNIDIVINEPDLAVGTPVSATKALGFDGVLNYYAGRNETCDLEFERAFCDYVHWNPLWAKPYVADADSHLVEKLGEGMEHGVTISAVGFYGPQGRELRLPLAEPELNSRISAFRYNGRRITNYEMESAALQGMARLMGHRAMTVCCIIANRMSKAATPNYKTAVEDLVETVLDRI